MKFVNKIVIFFGLLSFGKALASELVIELPFNEKSYTYESSVRLERILNDVYSDGLGGYFSTAAQLFDLNSSSFQPHKQRVFEQLLGFSNSNPDAKLLLEQLNKQQYFNRVFIELNRNYVLSQLKSNPKLGGRYALYLKDRPQFIEFFGVMKNTHRLAVIEGGQLTDYIKQLPSDELSRSANPSLAYAIQPDGKVFEVPYAYWNYTPSYFSPGTIIYIGFDSLPSEYATLNQDVVELLRHKVNF